ncbi:MAG: PAS domain S-box protein, partial [Chloroflexota bacterium]|nr:PAS domain S-box protein [Chloroflexota bacterium]
MTSRFDQILGSLPVPMMGTDADGRVTDWNHAAEQLFGWSKDEAIGRVCPAVPREETENYLEVIQRVMRGEAVSSQVLCCRKASTSPLVCSLSAAPRLNDDDNPVGVTILFEDITERRREEKQLLYEAQLLDKIKDAVIASDEHYVITSWNRAAEQMYGWRAEEAIGQNIVDLLQNEFLETDRPLVRQQLQEAEEWSGEIIQTRRDGTRIFVDASAVLLRDQKGETVGYLSINRDITERKQVAAVLREQTDFMKNVLENSPAAIYITGANNRLRLVNRAWEQSTGWTRADVIDKPLDQVFPLETAKKFQNDNLRVIETGAPYEYEEPLGSRYYLTVKFPLYDEAGTISSVGGISIDITARRQAEEALQHTEQLLKTVLHNVPLTIFATDRHGIFTMTEGRGLERVGLEHSQNVGMSAFQMYGGMPIVLQSGETVDGEEIIQRALAGGTITALVEMSGIYFENHVAPLYDSEGNITGIVGVAMDITDRKRAEDALRQSEQKYRQLVELTHDLVWSVDKEGRITYISPASRYIYDREPEEMIGLPFSDFVPEKQAHDSYARLAEAMRTGKTSLSSTSRVYHRDGREIVLSTKTVILKDETGAFAGLVGTSQDIT